MSDCKKKFNHGNLPELTGQVGTRKITEVKGERHYSTTQICPPVCWEGAQRNENGKRYTADRKRGFAIKALPGTTPFYYPPTLFVPPLKLELILPKSHLTSNISMNPMFKFHLSSATGITILFSLTRMVRF